MSEKIKQALLEAIIEHRFPQAVAIDHSVLRLLEDEAAFYARALEPLIAENRHGEK